MVEDPDCHRQSGVGDPPEPVLEGVPPEVFFALPFDGRMPRGTVAFHEGFGADC